MPAWQLLLGGAHHNDPSQHVAPTQTHAPTHIENSKVTELPLQQVLDAAGARQDVTHMRHYHSLVLHQLCDSLKGVKAQKVDQLCGHTLPRRVSQQDVAHRHEQVRVRLGAVCGAHNPALEPMQVDLRCETMVGDWLVLG